MPLHRGDCDGEEDGTEQCTICRMEFEKGDSLRTLPCKHRFHGECLAPWLKDNKCCPVCKHELAKTTTKKKT